MNISFVGAHMQKWIENPSLDDYRNYSWILVSDLVKLGCWPADYSVRSWLDSCVWAERMKFSSFLRLSFPFSPLHSLPFSYFPCFAFSSFVLFLEWNQPFSSLLLFRSLANRSKYLLFFFFFCPLSYLLLSLLAEWKREQFYGSYISSMINAPYEQPHQQNGIKDTTSLKGRRRCYPRNPSTLVSFMQTFFPLLFFL